MENELSTMMSMSFTDEPDLTPEGEYEFVIDSADKTKSKNGTTDYLKLKLKIRTDVNQEAKGSVLFLNIFRDKDNPNWYDYNTLKRIILTQKKEQPDGKKWTVVFNTCDDCIQYLIGLKLRARVVHEVYENATGDEVERAAIARNSFAPSTVVEHEITTDEDLPF